MLQCSWAHNSTIKELRAYEYILQMILEPTTLDFPKISWAPQNQPWAYRLLTPRLCLCLSVFIIYFLLSNELAEVRSDVLDVVSLFAGAH